VTEIQAGVPVPKRGRVSRYPLRTMDVGESFFTPGKSTAAMCAAVRRAAKDTDRDFTVRAVEENGLKGVRCWRTR
jgi:hypothetical protein